MSERKPQASGPSSGQPAPAWFDPAAVYVAPVSAAEEASARAEQPALPLWPVVVGLISLVLGLLSAGVHGALLATPALLRKVEQLGLLNLPAEAALPTVQPTPSAQVNALVRIAASLLLAVAGGLTLARLRAGAWLHLVYGGLGLVAGAWGVWEGLKAQAALAAWAEENPDTMAAQFIAQPGALSTVMGAAIALAWPVFVLVWFGVSRGHRADLGRAPKPAR